MLVLGISSMPAGLNLHRLLPLMVRFFARVKEFLAFKLFVKCGLRVLKEVYLQRYNALPCSWNMDGI